MTVSPARRRGAGAPRASRRAAAASAALVLVLALAAAACGTAAPRATPSASATAPGASGSDRPGPRITPWPGNAVLGIEGLGVADGEIRQAINDFGLGVQTEDLALMRRAADGLAGLGVLLEHADQIDIYDPLKPMAAQYREVVPRIVDAATRLRNAIDAGDAGSIGPASQDLAAALTDYAEIQPQLADWVIQSLEQKRILVR